MLQLVGGPELRDAEVAEVVLIEAAAVEEDGEPVLELHPALGVQQLDRGGGAPPAAPEVEVLGGGGPGRGEHHAHVAGRGRGLGAVVLRVVAHHLVDEAAEVGLGGGRLRGRRGAELLQVAGLLADPGLEELGEGLVGRQQRGKVVRGRRRRRRRREGGGHGDRCAVACGGAGLGLLCSAAGWRWALWLGWRWAGPVIKVVHVGHCVGPGALFSRFYSLFLYFFDIFFKIIFL